MALRLYSIFHCNIAFSSIAEEKRPLVVERCYWPLLRLARGSGKIAIEATGYTLEEVNKIDPAWIAELRALIAEGKVELLGSGYAQIVGPLVPAEVTRKNLDIGKKVYKELLGVSPRIAYLNEQTYSAGMPALYTEAGFEALVVDFNNPYRFYPEWDHSLLYGMARAHGVDGTIPVIWSDYVAFQKFQRYAHRELSYEKYVEYLGEHAAHDGYFPLYANDVEIFDFRPGRFRAEAKLDEGSEWSRIEELYAKLAADPRFSFVFPSEMLDAAPAKLPEIVLGSAAQPIIVKKQEKYNPIRWGVSGRDDISVNTTCYRIAGLLMQAGPKGEALWKDLCYVWDSDFRTHITRERFDAYRATLADLEARTRALVPATVAPTLDEEPMSVKEEDGTIVLAHPKLQASLIVRRGLAVESLTFPGVHPLPLVQTLPHGYYRDVPLAADYYVGNTNIDIPGHMRVTDLEPAQDVAIVHGRGGTSVSARMETPAGTIHKTIHFLPSVPSIRISYEFDLALTSPTSMRTGNVNLNPEAFTESELFYRTSNGGAPETYMLDSVAEIDPSPLNVLCSARTALGNTEGLLEMGDKQKKVWVKTRMDELAALPMMMLRRTKESYFLRVLYSLAEFDDTVAVSRGEPLPKFRFSIEIGAKKTT